MENEIMLKVGFIVGLVILVAWVILDSACLKKHRTTVIVRGKRFVSGVTGDAWSGFSAYQDYIIDFELDGKKHSTCVSSKFYKSIEKGDAVCLEYRKSRLAKIMFFEVLKENN